MNETSCKCLYHQRKKRLNLGKDLDHILDRKKIQKTNVQYILNDIGFLLDITPKAMSKKFAKFSMWVGLDQSNK